MAAGGAQRKRSSTTTPVKGRDDTESVKRRKPHDGTTRRDCPTPPQEPTCTQPSDVSEAKATRSRGRIGAVNNQTDGGTSVVGHKGAHGHCDREAALLVPPPPHLTNSALVHYSLLTSESDVQTAQSRLRDFRLQLDTIIELYGPDGDPAARLLDRVDKCEPLSRPAAEVIGHVRGVQPGEKFRSRHELAVLGIHGRQEDDIDAAEGLPCAALVLEGTHPAADDGSRGVWLSRPCATRSKSHASHKSSTASRGNAALEKALEHRTPVRVCRALGGKDGFVYEGLYLVADAEGLSPSKSTGICRFLLQPVPGHSITELGNPSNAPSGGAPTASHTSRGGQGTEDVIQQPSHAVDACQDAKAPATAAASQEPKQPQEVGTAAAEKPALEAAESEAEPQAVSPAQNSVQLLTRARSKGSFPAHDGALPMARDAATPQAGLDPARSSKASAQKQAHLASQQAQGSGDAAAATPVAPGARNQESSNTTTANGSADCSNLGAEPKGTPLPRVRSKQPLRNGPSQPESKRARRSGSKEHARSSGNAAGAPLPSATGACAGPSRDSGAKRSGGSLGKRAASEPGGDTSPEETEARAAKVVKGVSRKFREGLPKRRRTSSPCGDLAADASGADDASTAAVAAAESLGEGSRGAALGGRAASSTALVELKIDVAGGAVASAAEAAGCQAVGCGIKGSPVVASPQALEEHDHTTEQPSHSPEAGKLLQGVEVAPQDPEELASECNAAGREVAEPAAGTRVAPQDEGPAQRGVEEPSERQDVISQGSRPALQGGKALPQVEEVPPHGGDASTPEGDVAVPGVEEALPSSAEAFAPQGEAATPQGMDAASQGEDAAPTGMEADPLALDTTPVQRRTARTECRTETARSDSRGAPSAQAAGPATLPQSLRPLRAKLAALEAASADQAPPTGPHSLADRSGIARAAEAARDDAAASSRAAQRTIDVGRGVSMPPGPPAGVVGTFQYKLQLSDEDIAHAQRLLQMFRDKMKEMEQTFKKPDMKAIGALKDLVPQPVIGHVRGVRPGQVFNGRGELAILGIHGRIMPGIYFLKGHPCYAIAISKEYQDNQDDGDRLWYTGVGGQHKQKQIRDQKLENGNLALKLSHDHQTPVRVCRKLPSDSSVAYAYEGLYLVTEFKQEPSKDGPLIYRFHLRAIRGHSTVTCAPPVAFNRKQLERSTPAQEQRLHEAERAGPSFAAPPAGVPRPVPMCESPRSFHLAAHPQIPPPAVDAPLVPVATPTRARPIADAASTSPEDRLWRDGVSAAQSSPSHLTWRFDRTDEELVMLERARDVPNIPGLVAEDISCGAEHVRVPLINDTGVPAEPPRFSYIKDFSAMSPAAAEYVAELSRGGHVRWAGCKHTEGPLPLFSSSPSSIRYHHDMLLERLQFTPLVECVHMCRELRCNQPNLTDRGVYLPLQVFQTGDRGWGVRCEQDIPVGALVCCCIGAVITSAEADAQRQDNGYLLDLDHFLKVLGYISEHPEDIRQEELKLMPALPPPAFFDWAKTLRNKHPLDSPLLIEMPPPPHPLGTQDTAVSGAQTAPPAASNAGAATALSAAPNGSSAAGTAVTLQAIIAQADAAASSRLIASTGGLQGCGACVTGTGPEPAMRLRGAGSCMDIDEQASGDDKPEQPALNCSSPSPRPDESAVAQSAAQEPGRDEDMSEPVSEGARGDDAAPTNDQLSPESACTVHAATPPETQNGETVVGREGGAGTASPPQADGDPAATGGTVDAAAMSAKNAADQVMAEGLPVSAAKMGAMECRVAIVVVPDAEQLNSRQASGCGSQAGVSASAHGSEGASPSGRPLCSVKLSVVQVSNASPLSDADPNSSGCGVVPATAAQPVPFLENQHSSAAAPAPQLPHDALLAALPEELSASVPAAGDASCAASVVHDDADLSHPESEARADAATREAGEGDNVLPLAAPVTHDATEAGASAGVHAGAARDCADRGDKGDEVRGAGLAPPLSPDAVSDIEVAEHVVNAMVTNIISNLPQSCSPAARSAPSSPPRPPGTPEAAAPPAPLDDLHANGASVSPVVDTVMHDEAMEDCALPASSSKPRRDGPQDVTPPPSSAPNAVWKSYRSAAEIQVNKACDHLVIDSSKFGNVARFINHSCDANLDKQVLLKVQAGSAMFHYIGLFASRSTPIPAYTELTMDYDWQPGAGKDLGFTCLCGAANCRGRVQHRFA